MAEKGPKTYKGLLRKISTDDGRKSSPMEKIHKKAAEKKKGIIGILLVGMITISVIM
ncbi:unnamed protein product, partial [marine sediment metagenome]